MGETHLYGEKKKWDINPTSISQFPPPPKKFKKKENGEGKQDYDNKHIYRTK